MSEYAVCDYCNIPITLEEADYSYAMTDKHYLLCPICIQKYKKGELDICEEEIEYEWERDIF
jgi:hypothetical protein